MAQRKNIITVIKDGPLKIEGELKVYNTISELVAGESPVMLCRCGASNNKPFCDGSHERIGFTDCSEIDNSRDEDLEAYSPLTITCRPNAMLVVRGPMTIIGPDGQSRGRRNKAALCRCGASRNKPFCDISHKRVGFVDDALLGEETESEDETMAAQEQAEQHGSKQDANENSPADESDSTSREEEQPATGNE